MAGPSNAPQTRYNKMKVRASLLNITENSSPILASHVCRTWRNHALSTGTLWTKDELRTRRPNFEKHRTLMARAKGAPRDVTIDETPFCSSSGKHAKEIMRLLVPYVSHLRTLEVWRVPLKILRFMFDRLAELSAPQLRELIVKSHKTTAWYDEGRPTKWNFQPFVRTEAPNIREFNLDGINPTHVIGRLKGSKLVLLLPDLQYLLVGDGHFYNVLGHPNSMQLLPEVLPPPITHKALVHAFIRADPICSDAIMASLVLPKLQYVIDRRRVPPHPRLAEPVPIPGAHHATLGGRVQPYRKHRAPSERHQHVQLGGGAIPSEAASLAQF
ncbi:hypothetical protein FRB90_001469 [Tulasnella sp. 427]|nr:hypothetical protein FRB90_001469 [Tulasnella sp. 427]